MDREININYADGIYVVYLRGIYKTEDMDKLTEYYTELVKKGIESKCIAVDAKVDRIEYIGLQSENKE